MLRLLSSLFLCVALGSGCAGGGSPDVVSAFVPVESRFDTEIEGWTVVGDAQGQSSLPAHIEEGHLIATDDEVGGVWYWNAPEKFLGDQSGALGRLLTFRLRTNTVDNPFDDEDIVLEGGEKRIVNRIARPVAGEWTQVAVKLDESAGWTVEPTGERATDAVIQHVLSDLRLLHLRGEFNTGPDSGTLDDVVLGGNAD